MFFRFGAGWRFFEFTIKNGEILGDMESFWGKDSCTCTHLLTLENSTVDG